MSENTNKGGLPQLFVGMVLPSTNGLAVPVKFMTAGINNNTVLLPGYELVVDFYIYSPET